MDTIDSDGKIAWNAALSFVVNGDTDDHLEMLEIGVIKRLLEDKWATYAKVIFFRYLLHKNNFKYFQTISKDDPI